MSDELSHFRVSAALKDIIGGGLITDDIIAVFELVKNSFDAHASEVEIRFEGTRGPNVDARLVILDNGKGMTKKDIRDKWLFVAYSAKRDGTEDKDLRAHDDYRDLLGQDRQFAGAKGVGRFSCDRLGERLRVFTRRNEKAAEIETLAIEWQDFERDAKQRFEDVPVDHAIVRECPYPLRHGTVLEISGLRSKWESKNLLDLRAGLQKLINPGIGPEERPFRVNLVVPDEQTSDFNQTDDRKRVNGEIRNFLFDTLELKTTRIVCRISESGKTIETTLDDRDTHIYRLVEGNPDYDRLKNVRITLFYLNRAAKVGFKKLMGIEPVKYGSVFLYKNGFRVQPYGRDGDDGFGLDRRKQQGVRRYLGTRDLVGRIEITGDNRLFREASSRDNGLLESPEREQLFGFFRDVALRRLENYVVEVIEWGNAPTKGGDEITAEQVRPKVLELLKRLTDSPDVQGCEYNPDLLRIVTERQARGSAGLLENLRRIAAEHNDEPLRMEAKRVEKQVKDVLQAREEAQAEARQERKARTITEQQLAQERERNVYLKRLVGTPEEHRLSLTHWIRHSAKSIEDTIGKVLKAIAQGEFDRERSIEALAKVLRQCQQLRKVADLVTKANMDLKEDYPTGDMSRFLLEYLGSEESHHGGAEVSVTTDDRPAVRKFDPIEVAVLIDNLIGNAVKAGAGRIEADVSSERGVLSLRIANDGRGVPERVRETMFELGVSTTGGTGIGLFTCRQIVEAMEGEIRFLGNDTVLGGGAFELVFPV